VTRHEVRLIPVARENHVDSRHGGGLRVLDERDLDWVSEAIDLLAQHLGKPWRAVLDAFDELPASRRKIAAVRQALARLTAGATKLTPMATRVREAVLGAPVLDDDARSARISSAAAALGVDAAELESLLFMDLRGERSIGFARGRPSELEVAAAANVSLLQRALRRAHRVTLVLHGDDGTLLRAALARGLLVTASRATAEAATVLDIVGPLALFQRTAIYGRALGQLVPLLAHAVDFELVLEAPAWQYRIAAPVALPHAAIDRAGGYHARKLARGFEQLAPTFRVVVGPEPVQAGTSLLCPDLAIEDRGERRYIELVGFWTAESLRAKLALYTEARVPVLLCIDSARSCGEDNAIDDPRIVRYERRPRPSELLARWSSSETAGPSSSGPELRC
jgi:predicted nuclease of restriction endonuclease-like RecB superfamily